MHQSSAPSFTSVGPQHCQNSDVADKPTSRADSVIDIHWDQPTIESLPEFLTSLKHRGIQVQETENRFAVWEALMHDRAAVIPAYIVSPQSEWGVSQTLELLHRFQLYDQIPVSVKSGGHGYFNGATCAGLMIDLSHMNNRRVAGNVLALEPGCVLGQIVDTLRKHRKAVPHGDGFGVGAGGHFLTAGWDLILSRRYGLGCQSVISGRIVLWDGSVIEVDDVNHPDLLHAMRGGAAADAGVVTEIRLSLIDEPERAVWRFTRVDKEQLDMLVANEAFSRAKALPRDVSVSFRFYFEPDQPDPVCSFNIISLLTIDATLRLLKQYLGSAVTSLIADSGAWNDKALVHFRLLPGSDFLRANPDMLAEISANDLHVSPQVYWNPSSCSTEMARSYFTCISHWIRPECEAMLAELYEAFLSARTKPARNRMFAYIILGGGRMTELQDTCSMPLGQALARFEVHWDERGPGSDEQWCRRFTDEISSVFRSKEDPGPERPYRGDIWLGEQANDPGLDRIREAYGRRES